MNVSQKVSSDSASLLIVHVAIVFFGLAGLFGKLVDTSSFVIVFGRMAFGALALLVVMFARGEAIRIRSRSDVVALCGLGVLLAVHWYAFFRGIQESTVAIGLITFSTFPVFTSFIEPIVFNERLQLRDMIVAAVALAGVVCVTPEFSLENEYTQGALWGIFSGFTFALLAIGNRKYVGSYSGKVVALYQFVVGGLFVLPFVSGELGGVLLEDWCLLALLGVVFTGFSHTLFIVGLKRVRAQVAAVIACMEPVYGAIAAVFLLGEVPEFRVVLGGGIIVGAVVWVTVQKNRT